jgi:hypothetical protein
VGVCVVRWVGMGLGSMRLNCRLHHLLRRRASLMRRDWSLPLV